ncbi:hypothetical protein ACVWZV_008993 [Bradyrhizobium sp. GM5.1]
MTLFGVHPDLHLASSAAFFFRRRLLKIRFQHCTRRMIDAASDQQGPDGARKLLANSTAMSLTARLCSMVRIQSGTFKPRLASLMIEVAPTIKSVRRCRFPRFDIAPSLSFPPLDCALGVSPVQAAKSRAVAKLRASETDVRTVAAMRGPTPGMLIRRLASGSCLTAAKISLSSFSMRIVSNSICSANWIRQSGRRRGSYCLFRPGEAPGVLRCLPCLCRR